jgi:hypothetical protein
MLSIHAFAPAPAFGAPQLLAAITAVVDEFSEFTLRDRRARDRKRFDNDFVRPLLVVEDEARIWLAAELEDAAWDLRVAEFRVCSPGFSRNVQRRVVPPEGGTTNTD